MFHLFTVTKFFPWHAVLCHGIKHNFFFFLKRGGAELLTLVEK